MNEYLESIKTLEDEGTSVQEQGIPDSTPILEVSGEIPMTTSADQEAYIEEINQDTISYSLPRKIIVRTYRLRK